MAHSKSKGTASRGSAVAASSGAASQLQAELRRIAKHEVAKTASCFFKTGPGEYGEGDQFIGVKVPDVRRVARAFRELPLTETSRLLDSPIHEDRLAALVILVCQFERAEKAVRKPIFDLYLERTDRINNWDLVDVSAPQIVGGYLENRSRQVLRKLAKSASLWERRIAILATLHFIRQRDFADTLEIAGMLLADEHDLIHKATGWMLREVGKREEAELERFLDRFAATMPRTTLRYAIERLTEAQRLRYLTAGGKGRARSTPAKKPKPRALARGS